MRIDNRVRLQAYVFPTRASIVTPSPLVSIRQ